MGVGGGSVAVGEGGGSVAFIVDVGVGVFVGGCAVTVGSGVGA